MYCAQRGVRAAIHSFVLNRSSEVAVYLWAIVGIRSRGHCPSIHRRKSASTPGVLVSTRPRPEAEILQMNYGFIAPIKIRYCDLFSD